MEADRPHHQEFTGRYRKTDRELPGACFSRFVGSRSVGPAPLEIFEWSLATVRISHLQVIRLRNTGSPATQDLVERVLEQAEGAWHH
jgi:hypothetical protein